ncbi:phosphoribosylanthranilate isomerase [Candidatus Vidania fulgoroideorum]
MLTKIKFCGINNIDTIKYCIKLNIDAIGFVFYKKSVRNVSINMAVKMSKLLKYSYIYIFAVVYKPTISFLKKLFKKIKVDFLQYYGKENNSIIKICNKYNVKFVKVYKYENINDLYKINKSKYNYISIENKIKGGTGKIIKFNKNFKNVKKKIMISGGLNKNNIYYVVRKYKPNFIDISTGIESKISVKSKILMNSVIKEVYYSNIKNVLE